MHHFGLKVGASSCRVRDASIGLVVFLDRLLQADLRVPDPPNRPSWHHMLERAGLRTLELGTGCGIVGIYLASTVANSRCLLTDLPEAMELLRLNMQAARLAPGSVLIGEVLDWDQPLPRAVEVNGFDLIVISDCTYNCDSVPSLVSTMTSLALSSPSAIVLVSMKVRHESEFVFFEHIAANRFVILQHDTLHFPHQAANK